MESHTRAGVRWIALLVALAVPAAALAGSRERTYADGNDTRSALDLEAVRGAHNRTTDRLVHVIRTHDPISASDFRNRVSRDGPPASICVELWTTRTPGEDPPNYDVCITANRLYTKLVASVARHGGDGGVSRVAGADVAIETSRRLVLRFNPNAIRRPASYRWTTHSASYERGCPLPAGCEDRAPNSGRWVRTELGSVRAVRSRSWSD